MTILKKNWATTTTTTTSTGETTSSTSYDSYTLTTSNGTLTSLISAISADDYPDEAESVTSPAIRLCTKSEYKKVAKHLFGSDYTDAEVYQYLLNLTSYGKPELEYNSKKYIASWYVNGTGLGFYMFIGYSYSAYPKMTLYLNA